MSMDVSILAIKYVDICTVRLNANEFKQIVSKHVKLTHQTNNEEPIKAEGREAVTELFQKYIFSKTSGIRDKQCSLLSKGEKVLLELTVNENKHEENKINRYCFKETTLFEFKKKGDNIYKISSINTVIKRNPA